MHTKRVWNLDDKYTHTHIETYFYSYFEKQVKHVFNFTIF